jgi:hypothetical protein
MLAGLGMWVMQLKHEQPAGPSTTATTQHPCARCIVPSMRDGCMCSCHNGAGTIHTVCSSGGLTHVCPLCPTAAGTPLPTNTPLKISAQGSYVRNDNITAAATVGSGDGSTAPEQYVAFNPTNLADTQPVQPGSTAILKSVQVGWKCCTWFVPAWVFETRSLGWCCATVLHGVHSPACGASLAAG